MRLLTAEETATKLGISIRSLLDKRYRMRIGLPGVKVGRRIGFNEGDVERLMVKGKEKLPTVKVG